MVEGETVDMLSDPGDGWAEVLTKSGNKGCVPRNFLVTPEEYATLETEAEVEGVDHGKDEVETNETVKITKADGGGDASEKHEEKEMAASSSANEHDLTSSSKESGAPMVMTFEFIAEENEWQTR